MNIERNINEICTSTDGTPGSVLVQYATRERCCGHGLDFLETSASNDVPGLKPSGSPGADKGKTIRKAALKESLRVGCWNVRSLYQTGKLANVIREMKILGISILGISEVRWTGRGDIKTEEGFRFIYSGGKEHERGVGFIIDRKTSCKIDGYWQISDRVIALRIKMKPRDMLIIQTYLPTTDHTDEEVEEVYQQINQCIQGKDNRDILLIMGDMNAKVGRGREGIVIGPWGLGERNDRGERLIDFCREKGLTVMNTWFKHHERRLYTWKAPGSRGIEVRNQIDFILINHRYRNTITNIKTYPGADCGSDHNLLLSVIRVKLKHIKRNRNDKRLRIDDLKINNIREKYESMTNNRLQNLNLEGNVEELWENMKGEIKESAYQVLGEERRKARRPWITKEVLEKMDERRRWKSANTLDAKEKYRTIDKQVKSMELTSSEFRRKLIPVPTFMGFYWKSPYNSVNIDKR
ncbi:craniofacial development protein 2-like [Centruroides sculpturatus]|uniref:craniofacial development protein 2-like n=1 Tax=Centruroides sculpturatus TaxID=218467 RepID=UPI000C6D26C0|nr:craniofacial development protein 2-like [Centruroides sculpturatus]